MSNVVFLPNATPCEICAAAVGDRLVEGLLVCQGCSQILARPAPVSAEPADDGRFHPAPLNEIVDKLLRGAR